MQRQNIVACVIVTIAILELAKITYADKGTNEWKVDGGIGKNQARVGAGIEHKFNDGSGGFRVGVDHSWHGRDDGKSGFGKPSTSVGFGFQRRF